MTTRSIIAIAVAAAASLAMPIHAGEATLHLGSVGAEPGQTVRMPLSLSSDDLVGAFSLDVDSAGLTVASIDYNGPLFSLGWDGWDNTPAVGPNLNGACIFPQDQVTGDDIPVLDLLIEVPIDAEPNSEITIGFTNALVSNYSFIPYDVTIEEGTIVIVSDACTEDIDHDKWVGFGDLLAVITTWGPCGTVCDADVNGNGEVELGDLLMVLARWGACN